MRKQDEDQKKNQTGKELNPKYSCSGERLTQKKRFCIPREFVDKRNGAKKQREDNRESEMA